MTGRRIKVLVIDDSALIRALLSELLNSAPHIEVVGTASDPLIARGLIKSLNPDVLTLDIEMPNMDGLAFLERLMTLRPTPVVMVSSLTDAGADATMRALELGAVDFVPKPKIGLREGLSALREELIAKVTAAAGARVHALVSTPSGQGAAQSPAKRVESGRIRSTEMLVAIGASTGGVEALRVLIAALPADAPAVLIAQHMPARFTTTFAARLDSLSAVRVAEAAHGDRLLPGHVYLAPGGFHLRLGRSGANYVCQIGQDPPVSGHRPSVDALFLSVAECAGKSAIGVILTGMGRDGAEGLLRMREAGAHTIGEHESTAMIYGMPKAAFQLGATAEELPIEKIAPQIMALSNTQRLRI